jgi:hypothetical protein
VIWELAMNAFIHFTESSELSICLKQAVCFICLPSHVYDFVISFVILV